MHDETMHDETMHNDSVKSGGAPPGSAPHDHGFRPIDPGRVDAANPAEVAYWSRELGCSEAALRAAIGRVGEHIAALRPALRG